MAVQFRALEDMTAYDLAAFLDGGYSSPSRYVVHKTEDPNRIVLTIELIELESPYIKRWAYKDAEEMARYQGFACQPQSIGAYDGGVLVGLTLCESRSWNRTLRIWEFHVAPAHRRHGIGRAMMQAVVQQAVAAGFRAIDLETQNTNVPAIAFYRAVGFELDGIDLSFYTNTDAVDGEVAFFMRRKLG
jgi:streptothricin acetyltransferase